MKRIIYVVLALYGTLAVSSTLGPRLANAASFQDARETAYEIWPSSGPSGPLFTEIATPELVELTCEPLREEEVAGLEWRHGGKSDGARRSAQR